MAIGDSAHPDLTADWIELGTRIGLDGARVTAVRAGGLRMRATLAHHRLSLGSLDRLLPATGTGPFQLSPVDLDVTDAAMRLATPSGVSARFGTDLATVEQMASASVCNLIR